MSEFPPRLRFGLALGLALTSDLLPRLDGERQPDTECLWITPDPKVSRPLPLRRGTPPKLIQDLRWTAQVRLCQRDRRLIARSQHATQVVVAMARARVGLMWAMVHEVPVTP